ncbi:hypothetical protein M422DRAFT_273106 [Sphaerobolus stellatus SS14]|uniref:DUF6533 domain-containing protein n=1 Tax=Sphaerobolus stellatus (strain SS14) TaxID=990650 RepID=A0A0C9TVP5_SPHS4|nr:hypothetical protein M422DRAFT_273106 [Sphaerobolus stellatus SS14]
MATNSSTAVVPSPAEFVEEAFDTQAFAYALLAGFVLLVYDTLLTTAEEVKYIWGRKFRLGSLLYITARYGALVKLTAFILNYIVSETERIHPLSFCTITTYILSSADVVSTMGIQGEDRNLLKILPYDKLLKGLLLSRVYAVWRGPKAPIAAIVLILFVASVGISATFLAYAPCNSSMGAQLVFSVLNALIEALTTGITVYHTWREHKTLNALVEGGEYSFTTLFLRQGVIRFTILFAWGVTGAITQPLINPFLSGIDVGVEIAVSTILICRFMLQLRHFNDRNVNGLSASQDGQPPLGTFKAAIRRADETVTQEFGDLEPSFSSAYSEGPTELQNISKPKLEMRTIGLEEYTGVTVVVRGEEP